MSLFATLAIAGKAIYRHFVPAQKYELLVRLHGHRDAIHCIDASRRPDGKLVIASAGKDGIHLWELPSMSVVATPEPRHPKRGPPTALAWGSTDQDPTEYLAWGTANGYLCIMSRKSGSNDFVEVCSEQLSCRTEIVSLKCDLLCKEKDTIRIVTASVDGFVQAWTYDSLNRLLPILSVQVVVKTDAIYPKSAVFSPPNEPKRVVSVFGVTSNERVGVMTEIGEAGEVTKTHRVGGAGDITTAAVDDIRGIFVVDNGESTFDLCSLANANLIRSFTFRSREIECRLPLQVAFANEGRYVVGGSDHGVAYVYDRKTAHLFDTLHHALDDEALVQTVSTYDFNGSHYIFTATSGRSRHPYISVWKHVDKTKVISKQPTKKQRYTCCPTIRSLMRLVAQFLFFATFTVFAVLVIQELIMNDHLRSHLVRNVVVFLDHAIRAWRLLLELLADRLQNVRAGDVNNTDL